MGQSLAEDKESIAISDQSVGLSQILTLQKSASNIKDFSRD